MYIQSPVIAPPSALSGNPNEPTAAEKEAEKANAIKDRRSKTIEKARKKMAESTGAAGVYRR